MPILSLLAASHVVVMTNCGAAIDDKVGMASWQLSVLSVGIQVIHLPNYHQWPLLLTWIDFNPGMDK